MLSKILVAGPLALCIILPALAGTSKNVSIEDALEGRVPIVVAVEGGGVNIDFSETGETVQKVTLDDTSKVLVDFDKSLPIVRLFRGNVASKDVPSAKTTQLSVTTKGSDGDFHLYIFPITTSSRPATFTKFVIGGVSRKKSANTIATAAFGAKVAQQNKTLVDPKLKARVSHYVQLRSGGMSDRKAAKRAKISMALAKRLDDLGQSPNPIAQSPVLPVPSANIPKADTPKAEVPKVEAPKVAEVKKLPTIDLTSPSQGYSALQRVDNSSPASTLASLPKPVVKTATAPAKFDGQIYASALLKGLNDARIKGHIPYRSVKWYRVNGSIRALKRGQSLNAAIRVSGLKEDRFMELLRVGGLTL
jgi:hypothetical protein